MKIIFILMIIGLASIVSADQRAFYDSSSELNIIDVSGKKTKAQIAEEFKLNELNLQTISIDENSESVFIDGGVLKKKDFKSEGEQKKAQEKADKKAKKDLIKTKLGLSESDWKNLVEALR